jgi:hypothetical protein
MKAMDVWSCSENIHRKLLFTRRIRKRSSVYTMGNLGEGEVAWDN